MDLFKIQNLSFTYPNKTKKALCDINFSVNQGDFVVICGKSGCGKTTLLRLLKPSLSPFGNLEGTLYFKEQLLKDFDLKEQASKIGFVMQNPDNQIVTDKVWHELAFGLESLGLKTSEIRARVAEMASFFGIQTWFYKNVDELSGGQKQLLNLASVMVMNPDVLILDEPTSQLDPIAAEEFLNILKKINYELGTTIILTEHRLEDVFKMATKVIVMDNGSIISDATPEDTGKYLKNINHDMLRALPSPMRVSLEITPYLPCPLTIRDGRNWLYEYKKENNLNPDLIPNDIPVKNNEIIEVKDAYFRYEKNSPDVIKGLNLKINKGELFAIMGGNGTGKTTALSLISGLNIPYRGSIFINGQNISKINNLYDGLLGVLPQNPQSLFVKKTVFLDLMDSLSKEQYSEDKVYQIARLLKIEHLLDSHPYDLSGGEQQRAALGKVLLKEPEILLLDEPTKGMDAHFKEEFASILSYLKAKDVTIIMVSHDIEFCAEFADRCALFFDGNITSCDTPREFFKGKNFYTTAAFRMAGNILCDAVLTDDIIVACGGKIQKQEEKNFENLYKNETEIVPDRKQKNKLSAKRILGGTIFLLLFFVTSLWDYYGLWKADTKWFQIDVLKTVSILFLAISFFFYFPEKKIGINYVVNSETNKKLTKRTLVAAFLILILIPLTIYTGFSFLNDKKYYFISLLIILETIIPFVMVFESRKPQARELVIISVLCTMGVIGRTAFFMLPEFKPVVAIVIISGICFGGETGFLVGTVTGFVSNFFFGQGPWAPWQMFSFGIIGFISGILFTKGILKKSKIILCIFGFLATFIIYGGIMNPASVIMWQGDITLDMILSSYIVAIPFDLIHSISTAFFLWFIAEPMIEKLERVKIKYGLIEG